MPQDSANEPIGVRRKRCLYRASHRGTKEMDWLLGRFAEVRLPKAAASDLDLWERLADLPDPELHNWIMGRGEALAPELAELVDELRAYQGISPRPGAGR
jgi:antitoxin CptB